jgi:hypothetical protein
MRAYRWLVACGVGVAIAAGLAVPALQAREAPLRAASRTQGLPSGIGSFTPAAADPKLAAVLARSGLSVSGFRFTPSESRKGGLRAVTVAVRARSNRATEQAERAAALPTAFSIAPVAYDLGVAVGWKRFAVSGDIAKIDLAGQPGSRESVDLGVSYTGKKVSGRVKAGANRPLVDAPRLIADTPSYSIDVGGSYSVTRNLAVTAGVRYKSEEDRLPLRTEADNRRDSQAVYIGTAFRF